MYVRLAFSVAAQLRPEILLLDEVLAVGDLSFQRKCIDFAKSLQRGNSTILFVSHNMFSIKTMCDRVIYLKQGQDRLSTDRLTRESSCTEEDCQLGTCLGRGQKVVPTIGRSASSRSCETLVDESGTSRSVFDYGDCMRLRLSYVAKRPVDDPNFIVAFVRADGVACCNYNTETDGIETGRINGTGVVELLTPPLRLTADSYVINIIVREKGFQRVLCAQIGSTFHVRHHLFDSHFGVFHETGKWRLDIHRVGVPTFR